MEKHAATGTENSGIVSPREMATRLDNVHSSADFESVYQSLARSTDAMSQADTLQYMRQISGFEKKGVGADLNVSGTHIELTSPYENTDIGLTNGSSK
ncbi:MAG TPA: hypothetical protein V6C69_18720 [Trichormus sp.]